MASTKKKMRWLGAFTLLLVLAAACSSEAPSDGGDEAALGAEGGAGEEAASEAPADPEPADAGSEPAGDASEEAAPTEEGTTSAEVGEAQNNEFFDQELYDAQLAQLEMTPEGPEGEPWVQMIEPEMVDTSEYATEGPHNICFSNASVDNPWRQWGFSTMEQEVVVQGDAIENFEVTDAGADDATQISDIEGLVSGGECDALIVSPNTTASLTPAVEAACEELPVIVFDRGVNTDCPVTFIHPIGGFAFGAQASEFIIGNVDEGANVLALRVLPGVDVLEQRYISAEILMQEAGLNIVGAEFTGNDNATVNSVVTDYLQRDDVDAIWMDDGSAAVAAIEAFEDAGAEPPVISGEDQQAFMRKVTEDGITGFAPTYPTFQWRTAVIAAEMILNGEEVPSEWILPQPSYDAAAMEEFVNPELPPLAYAACGCQEMPDYPAAWQ